MLPPDSGAGHQPPASRIVAEQLQSAMRQRGRLRLNLVKPPPDPDPARGEREQVRRSSRDEARE
jgi:hypothetical protein